MNEKNIFQICLIISIIGIFLFIFFYESDFQKTSLTQILEEEGNKGIVFGKVSFVIKEEPTIFIFENETSVKAFSPKKLNIAIGDELFLYAETQIYRGEKELFIYRVEK
jgi:hypothetical protein